MGSEILSPESKRSTAEKTIVLLMDNGSLRPAPVFQLREFARRLSEHSGMDVRPVSVLHSHKIDPSRLNNQAAESAEPFLLRELSTGSCRQFLVLPMFIGPSLALTEYLPELFQRLSAETKTPIKFHIAAPLAGNSVTADPRLADILVTHILKASEDIGASSHTARVAIVDHGTPLRTVNAIREDLVHQVRVLLKNRFETVIGAAMERKPGPDYAFNDPLLEEVPEYLGFEQGPLIVAMLFLLSGRHAGEGGDVAQICDGIQQKYPKITPIIRTALLGEDPRLLAILLDRLKAGAAALPKHVKTSTAEIQAQI